MTLRPSGGLSQREIVEIISRRREEETRSSSHGPHHGEPGGMTRLSTRDLPAVKDED